MKNLILSVATVAALALILPQSGRATQAGPPLFRVHCEYSGGTRVETVEPRGIRDARYRCEHLWGGKVIRMEVVRDSR